MYEKFVASQVRLASAGMLPRRRSHTLLRCKVENKSDHAMHWYIPKIDRLYRFHCPTAADVNILIFLETRPLVWHQQRWRDVFKRVLLGPSPLTLVRLGQMGYATGKPVCNKELTLLRTSESC